jgi:hypothetical protein
MFASILLAFDPLAGRRGIVNKLMEGDGETWLTAGIVLAVVFVVFWTGKRLLGRGPGDPTDSAGGGFR